MNRRDFLRRATLALAGSAAGLALDPGRLLWVPGAKTYIFMPEREIVVASTLAQALQHGLEAVFPDGTRLEVTLGGGVESARALGWRTVDEQLAAEVASIQSMGGRVVARRRYEKHQVTQR